MRKTCIAILGMALGTIVLTATPAHADRTNPQPRIGVAHTMPQPAQESSLRPNCQGFFKTKSDTRSVDGSDVTVTTKLNARQCYGPGTGNRWVDPISVEFSYNKEGSHESCGFFDIFEGVHYDLYLKDSTNVGRNYHLPRVRLACEEDTTGWTIESLSAAPSDFRMCALPPQWKTNWTIERDNQNDQSGSHGGHMWDFIGPVKDECGH